jgi:hypothetical protein
VLSPCRSHWSCLGTVHAHRLCCALADIIGAALDVRTGTNSPGTDTVEHVLCVRSACIRRAASRQAPAHCTCACPSMLQAPCGGASRCMSPVCACTPHPRCAIQTQMCCAHLWSCQQWQISPASDWQVWHTGLGCCQRPVACGCCAARC